VKEMYKYSFTDKYSAQRIYVKDEPHDHSVLPGA